MDPQSPPQPVNAPIQPSPKRFPIVLFTLSILTLLLLSSTSFLAYQNTQLTKQIAVLKTAPSLNPTTTPTLTQINTANWKTFANQQLGITLKYPSFYSPVEKFKPLKSGESIFIVTGLFNFNPQNLSLCKTYQESLCLIPGKNWSQAQDILLITVSGKKAVSFFVSTTNIEGPNNVIHVVQTTEKPFIEIALEVSGQGGEETFQQILSTFTFVSQDETTNWITTTSNNAFISGIPYSFKYPPTATIGGAGDFTTITVNGSEIRFGYYGKQGDINTLMNNYQPFAAPGPLKFTNKESVSLNGLTGYKATATNSTATYYFLASQTKPTSVILFTFTTGDTAAENLLLKIIGTIKTN